MHGELNIPLWVAEKGIKLTNGWVFPSNAPCELPILKVDFFQLAVLKHALETVETTCIHISLVVVCL